LADRPVLLLGYELADRIAAAYGMTNTVSTSTIVRAFPEILPARLRSAVFQNLPPASAEDVRRASQQFEAVIMLADSADWQADLVCAHDCLVQGGKLTPDSPVLLAAPQVPLFLSNPDLTFAAAHASPRLTQGSLGRCLQLLYEQSTGRQLMLTQTGKPRKENFDCASKLLAGQLQPPSEPKCDQPPAAATLSRCYHIGDNVLSDVRGANQAEGFVSVLVRTGLGRDVNLSDLLQSDVPDIVAETVGEAVCAIFAAEGLSVPASLCGKV
jgi:ribonucleotide monophosphatase NagD (HAD superfamily)